MCLHSLGFLGLLAILLFRLGDLHPDQGLRHEHLDSFEHFSEDLKSFYLVLDKWISLRIASQSYCITKIFKSRKMVLPSKSI